MRKAGITYSNPEKLGPYAAALEMAAIEPVPLRLGTATALDGLDGLLISGGRDVDPAAYGEAPHPLTDSHPDRDRFEALLLEEAFARDLPVLCICRGLQLLNVVRGGSLIQHLDGHGVRSQDPGAPAHDVVVEPGTHLARILGPGLHPVNSRHHQAVNRLGRDLRISARSADGSVIEAVEATDRSFVLAVQWHPEDQARADRSQRKLFEEFARVLEEGGATGAVRDSVR